MLFLCRSLQELVNTSHNFDYLKNVVLGYIESGNDEKMLPVVAELLQFSPEELRRCEILNLIWFSSAVL